MALRSSYFGRNTAKGTARIRLPGGVICWSGQGKDHWSAE